MKKFILYFLTVISIFAGDFRDVDWGMSRREVFVKEKIDKMEYSEHNINKTFTTYMGEMTYNYVVDEYVFYDEIASLGEFKITYTFLKDKLIKSKYEQSVGKDYVSFNRIRKYLVWKYGTDYEVFGYSDNFIWKNERSRIILDLIPNSYYTVEYYANTKEINEFIANIENGREFLKNVGTEYEEFNNIKDKI
jgi:hypothetical protein